MVRCIAAALVLCLYSASMGAETVLLDFSSPFCGPCKQLEPTIDRLSQEGFPIRKVDVTRDTDLKARFRVSEVPCLVMIVDGQEVQRMHGVADYGKLRTMLLRYAAKPVTDERPSLRGSSWSGGASPTQTPATQPGTAHTNPAEFEANLLASTVRLKVADAQGFGYGTGTIVDTQGPLALVVTCGHLFRDSDGKGKITVELFAPSPEGAVVVEQVDGELIAFDDRRDVGLLSIRPSRQVSVCRVAPQSTLRENDRVWSVGCNNGENPTIMRTRVTGIQHTHVNAAYRPVEGRSGGGLFNEQGQLVGVCTGAYQETDEGLYAALESLHAELDRADLSFVYAAVAEPVVGDRAAATSASSPTLVPVNLPREESVPLVATRQNWPASAPPIRPAQHSSAQVSSGAVSPVERAALEEIATRAIDCEVVVIVRPKDASGRSEVMTLDNVSPQFVDQLRQMRQPTGSRLAVQP